MRLGKIQAAGYIEDTEPVTAADAERFIQPESTLSATDPEPAVPAAAAG